MAFACATTAGSAGVVATDSHGESEREEERNEAEKCSLEDSERFAKGVSMVAQAMPEKDAHESRSEDNRKQQQRELDAAQSVKHSSRF